MNYIYTTTNAFVKRFFGYIRTFPFVYIFLNGTVDRIFWQVWEGASEDWQRFSTTESRLLSMDARPPEKTTKKLLKTTIVILNQQISIVPLFTNPAIRGFTTGIPTRESPI